MDLSSVLNDIDAPAAALPLQRARRSKAAELCWRVKSLGAALLGGAGEAGRRGARRFAPAQQESTLLRADRGGREQQEDEATQIDGAARSARRRRREYLHYQRLLGVQNPRVPAEGQPSRTQTRRRTRRSATTAASS